MAELKVNNTIYNYPDPGTEPGWGNDATEWAKAITEAVDSLAGAGSIVETQSIIANNISVATPVAGLQFNSALTKSAIVFYRIFRDTDITTPVTEQGELQITLDNTTWKLSRTITVGDSAGVLMDIDSVGQVNYTSSNISGSSYEGFIRFKTNYILK